MKFGIVVDSSSDLYNKDFINDKYDFTVVPLHITIGGKDYIDDDNLDIDNFIHHMEDEQTSMSTSVPSPKAFKEAYDKSDNVFCFTISSQLSGCYNCALLGREMSLEENPNKNIFVLDSRQTAGSLVLLVNEAIKLINLNYSYELIKYKLMEYQKTLMLDFTLGNYKMLMLTGRMSTMVGNIAGQLDVRSIATIGAETGTIQVFKKVHGIKKLYKELFNEMKSKKDLSQSDIYIHHCYNEDDANILKELIIKEFPKAKITINKCKGITTFYAQKEGIIVSY